MKVTDSGIASFGPFRLSSAMREITRDGAPLRLGDRALDILIVLVERAGEVVTHRELIARAWRGLVVNSGSLRVNMTGLRRALGDGENGLRYIENVTGQGYCFVAPVKWGDDASVAGGLQTDHSVTAELVAELFTNAEGESDGPGTPDPDRLNRKQGGEPYISNDVEYALHCLLFLLDFEGKPIAMRALDLADLQGIPIESLERIVGLLCKAQIVVRVNEPRTGLALARAPGKISFLDVILALDGKKTFFECRNVRARCAVFGGNAPQWAIKGVCSIHAVMMEAELGMRAALARHSLADLASRVYAKAPPAFVGIITNWLTQRVPDNSSA